MLSVMLQINQIILFTYKICVKSQHHLTFFFFSILYRAGKNVVPEKNQSCYQIVCSFSLFLLLDFVTLTTALHSRKFS